MSVVYYGGLSTLRFSPSATFQVRQDQAVYLPKVLNYQFVSCLKSLTQNRRLSWRTTLSAASSPASPKRACLPSFPISQDGRTLARPPWVVGSIWVVDIGINKTGDLFPVFVANSQKFACIEDLHPHDCCFNDWRKQYKNEEVTGYVLEHQDDAKLNSYHFYMKG